MNNIVVKVNTESYGSLKSLFWQAKIETEMIEFYVNSAWHEWSKGKILNPLIFN